MSEILLEVCVDSLSGVRAAIAGGADRIELCSALELGGLTPAPGLARESLAIARAAGRPIHAMLRPRAGGFRYDADELEEMRSSAAWFAQLGFDGLVYGIVDGERIDVATSLAFGAAVDDCARQRATPIARTLHRAIDVVADPAAAVDDAVACGFDRILTSGGARTAWEGRERIRAMTERAGERCRIMAGGGVSPASVTALVARTGVREVHASASLALPREGGQVAALGLDSVRRRTRASSVAAIRRVLDSQAIAPIADQHDLL